jgi:hypothetical protein
MEGIEPRMAAQALNDKLMMIRITIDSVIRELWFNNAIPRV